MKTRTGKEGKTTKVKCGLREEDCRRKGGMKITREREGREAEKGKKTIGNREGGKRRKMWKEAVG